MTTSNSPAFTPLLVGADPFTGEGSSAHGGGPGQSFIAIFAGLATAGGPGQAMTAIQAGGGVAGGPGQAMTAIQGGGATVGGGPGQAATAVFGGGVQNQGGPGQAIQTPTGGPRMGNIQGRTTRAHTIPGGVGFLVDGAAVGSPRENLNLQQTPGIRFTVNDNPGADRSDVEPLLDAEIELGRIAFDATQAPTDFLIQTAPGTGIIATRYVARSTGFAGFTSHPNLSLGQNTPTWDDILGSTAMAFTATNQVREERVASGTTVEFVPNGTDLRLALVVAAVATTYDLEVIVFGRVVQP